MIDNIEDTIVALGSPSGESAIGLVRISGDKVLALRDAFPSVSNELKYRHAYYSDYLSIDGTLLDQVVATFYKKGYSYTGEYILEIACHGNPMILQKVIEDVIARGCRPAVAGEFTKRAFLSGKMDLTQSEAVMELIRARNEEELAIAHKQLSGGLRDKVDFWIEELLQVIAEIEAYIDFPEEDLPQNDEDAPAVVLKKMADQLTRLADTSKVRTLLQDGFKTLIIGQPNAGKSSLLNYLLGEDRALVSDQPGTTRDFVREKFYLEDLCIQIMDTAGIRSNADDLEKLGIDKALELAENADFFLIIIDPADVPSALPSSLIEKLNDKNCLCLINKADQMNDEITLPNFLNSFQSIKISALTGYGIDDMKKNWSALLRDLIGKRSSNELLVNTRHSNALRKAVNSLLSACDKIENKEFSELVSFDLREAQSALTDIVGVIDNERMLDKLFNSFCIGK